MNKDQVKGRVEEAKGKRQGNHRPGARQPATSRPKARSTRPPARFRRTTATPRKRSRTPSTRSDDGAEVEPSGETPAARQAAASARSMLPLSLCGRSSAPGGAHPSGDVDRRDGGSTGALAGDRRPRGRGGRSGRGSIPGRKRLIAAYMCRSPQRRLLGDVEALRHEQVQVLPGARHRHVEQAPLLLDLGGVAGRHVRRDAAVDDVEHRDRAPLLALGRVDGREDQVVLVERSRARTRRWWRRAGRASAR